MSCLLGRVEGSSRRIPPATLAALGSRYKGEPLATVEDGAADVAPGADVDDVLSDVGGVVADALQVLRHQDQLESRKDEAGILHHVGEQDEALK